MVFRLVTGARRRGTHSAAGGQAAGDDVAPASPRHISITGPATVGPSPASSPSPEDPPAPAPAVDEPVAAPAPSAVEPGPAFRSGGGEAPPPRWFDGPAVPPGGSVVLADIDRSLVQVFALVGEGIAGATHALLAGDRAAAKELVTRDELVDHRIAEIGALAQRELVSGDTTEAERRELVAVLRMLPDLDRNGDLVAHVARRAARGLGSEMSARSRGLVERMGEVAANIWSNTADGFAERSAAAAGVVDALDDEMDDLHVTLTAELVAGTMPLPVAIELAMVARFYERFGDHAVSLARRVAFLVSGGPEPPGPGAD